MNLHTHGGYFMWAPGAYKSAGRKTLPAPNIGIEQYFFQVSDDVLSQIKSSRDTVILPQRTGPIADVLYSAAGNSADDMYYRKGIIGYSFEAGAQRITVNPTTGAITRTERRLPAVLRRPRHQRRPGLVLRHRCANPTTLLVNEGHDEAMEFAEGNLGLINGALDVLAGRHAAGDDDPVLGRTRPAATRSTTSSIGSARARSSTTRPTAPRRSSCRTISPRRSWTSAARTRRRPSATRARVRACRARS